MCTTRHVPGVISKRSLLHEAIELQCDRLQSNAALQKAGQKISLNTDLSYPRLHENPTRWRLIFSTLQQSIDVMIAVVKICSFVDKTT